MTTIVPRYTNDPLAYDFEVLVGDEPANLSGATFDASMILPDKTTIVVASGVATLASPEEHVIQVTFNQGVLTEIGQHELQLKVTIPARPEPIRSRVFVVLENSAI